MRILGSSNHALVIEVPTNPGARRYANPLARILDPGSFRQSNHGMLRCDVGTSRDLTHTASDGVMVNRFIDRKVAW
jgi:hypothetical protein